MQFVVTILCHYLQYSLLYQYFNDVYVFGQNCVNLDFVKNMCMENTSNIIYNVINKFSIYAEKITVFRGVFVCEV